MAVSNYEITRNEMRKEFLKYDQEKMIRKYSLEYDGDYLYLEFLKRRYRIGRRNGVAEWSEDGFQTAVEADFNESMTIYDVLCYAKEGCCLSGRYCTINRLRGVLKSGGPGGELFQSAADSFSGRQKELEDACGVLGENTDLNGDVAARLYPFSFLPVILQYWDADDEFPASLKFMFDENTIDYMHYETIFYMVGHMVRRLKEIMDRMQ